MSKKPTKKDQNFPALGKLLLATESEELRKRAVMILAVICGLLFIADFFHLRHGKFSAEDIPGFYGIVGFAAFSFIILSTKLLKKLLSRAPDYYGDSGTESEKHPKFDLDIREHNDG